MIQQPPVFNLSSNEGTAGIGTKSKHVFLPRRAGAGVGTVKLNTNTHWQISGYDANLLNLALIKERIAKVSRYRSRLNMIMNLIMLYMILLYFILLTYVKLIGINLEIPYLLSRIRFGFMSPCVKIKILNIQVLRQSISFHTMWFQP